MDEFNRNFDPTDEYMSLEDENSSDSVAVDNTTDESILTDSQEPVQVETVEDDVFEAFDKASNTPSPYENPIPSPTAQPFTQAPSYPSQQNGQRYTAQPTVQYNAPINNQPFNHPQYMPPQYMPPRQPQPQYANPTPMPQPPMYSGQYNQNTQPVGQYTSAPAQPAPQPQYNNPYQQQQGAGIPAQSFNPYGTAPAVKKEKTPKKTKVLIGVLIGLLVAFAVGFVICCWSIISDNTPNDPFKSDNPLAQFATEPEEYNFDEYFGDDYYGSFGDNFSFAPQYEGDYFDEKITLQADEGQTQQGDNDKNSYAPNKDAKGIELNKLPKDKDNKKYTTQYAYNAVTDSVVSILCYEDEITDNVEDVISEGTGTVISSDGYIVTNSHVIGDTKQYTINVVLNNAKEYKAKVVGFDTRTDIAVLKIDAKDLSYAKFSDSSLVEVGQDIVAIGNPGGQSFQNSLTKGIVSAVDRELTINSNVSYIQLDAAINPGNSGGPLCNLYGYVIGINTAKIASEEYEGMGFAIPANTVAEIANDLIHYGYVKDRVMLGLVGMQVDDEMVYSYDVPYGILITTISEGGPIDSTEITEYDILTAINDVEVKTFQDVYKELSKYEPGDKVTLTLYRLKQ
ncbi:MAG: trypsin-like peptidase domain-containing protein [Ruminococcus sp.]|nr:trypsin-like peptidase domain-containing protein [Ruminococcus sp.]